MPIKQKAGGAASTGALIFGLVALAFGFAAGYVAGEKHSAKQMRLAMPDSQRTGDTPDGGPGYVAPQGPRGELRSVQGTVVSLDGGILRLTALLPGDAEPTQFTVTLTASTAIGHRKELSSSEFEAAQKKFIADDQAFSEAAAAGKADGQPPRPPEPFRIDAGTAADLKAGQHVTVTSATAISGNAFEAESVQIISEPPPTEAGATPLE